MPRSLTWLHLSDLHLCEPRADWEFRTVLDTLIEDLKRLQTEHALRPDFIFFTGDAVFGHLKEENGYRIGDQFVAAGRFLKRVRQVFEPEILPENVFIVPGNHDINRSSVEPADTEWLEQQGDERNIIALLRACGPQWQSFSKRLKEYRTFLEEQNYRHLVTSDSHFHYATVRDVRGVKIGVAGFNSAWTCSRDKEKGRLWVGSRWQIETLAAVLEEAQLRIALIHHPPGWFVEQEDNQFARLIKAEFDFHLHGHEHESWVDTAASGHTRIAAGAGFDSAGSENGYNLVQLDLATGKGNIWLRKYERKGQAWVPEIVAQSLTDNNGRWALGGLRKSTWQTILASTAPKIEQEIRERTAHWVEKILVMRDPKRKGIKVSTSDPAATPQVWSTAQCLVPILKLPAKHNYGDEIRDALNYIEKSRKSREDGWTLSGAKDATVTEIGCWAALSQIESLFPNSIWTRKQARQEMVERIRITLKYLLKRQYEDGGCCPTRELNSKNTRTYPTTLFVWTLSRLAMLKEIEISFGYEEAMIRAIKWLLFHHDEKLGWIPNPGRRGQTKRHLGLHAQTLFCLLEAQPHCEFLRQDPAFKRIKEQFLSGNDFEARGYDQNSSLSGEDQMLSGTDYRLEGSVFLWCPWTVAALRSLSKDEGLAPEAREIATQGKSIALAKLPPVMDEVTEMWELAECLLGVVIGTHDLDSERLQQPRARQWLKSEILEIYRKHPLQEHTIIQRLNRQKKDLTTLTELDLAVDDETEITDQNHIGGIAFTEELAQRLDIKANSLVLDIGAGLGGTARVVANLCQCHVQGIELTPIRHADAVHLTERLGLSDRVQFICGDFMTETLSPQTYDVLIAQSTFAHFPEKKALIARCALLLKRGGRLAVEDAFLSERELTASHQKQLAQLENAWKSYLPALPSWIQDLKECGFVITLNQDCTADLIKYLSNLLQKTTKAPEGTVSALEKEGWRNGLELANAGRLVYARIIARRE